MDAPPVSSRFPPVLAKQDCVVAFASRRHRELPIVKILEQAVAEGKSCRELGF